MVFQEDMLDKYFEIFLKMDNSCINEPYKSCRTAKKIKKENDVFSSLNKQFGLFEYSIYAFLKLKTQRFKKNIDAQSGQKIGKRTFLD